MTELEKYTIAVSTRKAISRNPTIKINFAVVSQLEENDIPLLLEILRVQDKALEYVANYNGLDDDAIGEALRARIKVEELAASGSSARWGDTQN
jgi:hypothetical protein